MTDLDRQIEEALDAEDRALLDQFGEQGLWAQWFSVYQGRQTGVAIMATVAVFVLLAAGVYSAARFLSAGDAVDVLRWGAAAWFLISMVAFMKVWFWMRMESNRILREVKRLELQVARLRAS